MSLNVNADVIPINVLAVVAKKSLVLIKKELALGISF